MKSIFNYILLLPLLCCITACSDELASRGDWDTNTSFDDGIAFTVSFPEMGQTSRAFGESTDINSLDFFIFVFDGNNLSQIVSIPRSDTDWSDEAKGRIKFKAKLQQTNNDATIHIIAIDDSDGKFAAQISRVGYGLEDIVMPALNVDYPKDAYWQRVELGCRIKTTIRDTGDEDLILEEGTEQQVGAKFAVPVPLIRNFAKISMSSIGADNKPLTNFDIKGFVIINDLDKGSVVPWYSPIGSTDLNYPQYCLYDSSSDKNIPKSYEELTASGYTGVAQAGAKVRNTVAKVGDYDENATEWKTIVDETTGTTDAKYLYERPYNTSAPLYVVVYGYFHGNSEYSGAYGYYKLSLGKRDENTGLVTDYNVIRNIRYNININEVKGPGFGTLQEAMDGPAFNNVSGDVSTKSMTQISDGVDMLMVNQLNFVVTRFESDDDKIHFRYRYLTGVNTSSPTVANQLVKYKYDPVDNNTVGIQPGDVVASFTEAADYREKDGSIWKEVVITPNEPTNELKQQKFIVYSPPSTDSDGTLGLSRIINLVLRNPWDFVRMEVFPGIWEDADTWPDFDPDKDDSGLSYVGAEIGDPLTIFFELPAGLPEAMFPLDFTFESDRQNIENLPGAQAVVSSGQSYFDGVNEQRIQYTKTVRWEDYAPDGQNSTPASRIFRARFATTTAISSLADDEYVSTVILHNAYFNNAEDKFKRAAGVTPELPIILFKSWNMSAPDWSDIIEQLRSGASARYLTFGPIDGLSFYSGGENNTTTYGGLKSGNDTDGSSYIQIYRRNNATNTNQMIISIPHPQRETTGKGKLTITASNATNSGTSSVSPTITVTGGSNLQAVSGATFTTKGEKSWIINVPSAAQTVGFTIIPSANTTGIRIYEVRYEFWLSPN